MEKCVVCKKKTIVVQCKCEKQVCLLHRIPELHECSFDFKEHSRKQIEKSNPVIKSLKIDII
jgi:predicted nucleic acid binding AN1-type Zn finger protein